MIKTGILNPALLELLARFRHTNTLVIADRGFPSWPGLQTVDLSLVDNVPTVLQVLDAVLAQSVVGSCTVATQFAANNTPATVDKLRASLGKIPLRTLEHNALKQEVPRAIGLIRTGDTTQYANIIIESA